MNLARNSEVDSFFFLFELILCRHTFLHLCESASAVRDFVLSLYIIVCEEHQSHHTLRFLSLIGNSFDSASYSSVGHKHMKMAECLLHCTP